MADSATPNRGLILMQTGGDIGIWGAFLNSDALSILDNNLGGNLTKSVAGNSDVDLSSSEAENLYYNLTGALTGNINVVWPSGAGFYIVSNNTTGAFTLTLKPTGGTGVVLPQSSTSLVFISTNTGTAFLIGGATGTAGGDLTGTYPNPTIAKIQGTAVSGVTGTGNAVLSSGASLTSPTLVTPTIGAASGTSLTLSGLTASELVGTDGSKNLVSVTALTGASLNLSGLTASRLVAADGSKNLTSITALPNGTTATTQSPGDNSTKVATTAYADAATSNLFTKGTSCIQNPVTSNTKTSTAHGLGSTPTFFVIYLQCITGESGYSAGDIVPVSGSITDQSTGAFTVSGDATNTNISTFNPVEIAQVVKAGGTDFFITLANWKIVAIPYVVN
jgi:hypothetical protein